MAKKARRAARPRPAAAVEPAQETQSAVTAEPVQEAAPQTVQATPVHRQRLLPSGGAILYIFGLVVAIIAGLWLKQGLDYWTYLVLALLGFIVAFMNITEDEATLFLLATVTFVISAGSVRGILQNIPGVSVASDVLVQVLANMIIFTSSSAFIISLKEIVKIAKNK